MYEGQEKIRNGDLLFVFGVWVRVGGKNEKQNIDDSANKCFPSSLPWFFFTFIILSLLVFSSFLHFFPPYFYLSFLSSLILLPWCHIMCCGMALFAFLPQKNVLDIFGVPFYRGGKKRRSVGGLRAYMCVPALLFLTQPVWEADNQRDRGCCNSNWVSLLQDNPRPHTHNNTPLVSLFVLFNATLVRLMSPRPLIQL